MTGSLLPDGNEAAVCSKGIIQNFQVEYYVDKWI